MFDLLVYEEKLLVAVRMATAFLGLLIALHRIAHFHQQFVDHPRTCLVPQLDQFLRQGANAFACPSQW